AEGILLLAQEFVDCLVEAFRMEAIDLCRVHTKRTVHEDGNPRQLARQRQLMQGIDDLLCAADGKRGDDYLPPALHGFAHHLANFSVGARLWRMLAKPWSARGD